MPGLECKGAPPPAPPPALVVFADKKSAVAGIAIEVGVWVNLLTITRTIGKTMAVQILAGCIFRLDEAQPFGPIRIVVDGSPVSGSERIYNVVTEEVGWDRFMNTFALEELDAGDHTIVFQYYSDGAGYLYDRMLTALWI